MEPRRHLLAKDRIRQAVDPSEILITDDTIFHILGMVGGDLQRATHKCILAIQVSALRSKDGAVVTLTRNMLQMHEAGLLLR